MPASPGREKFGCIGTRTQLSWGRRPPTSHPRRTASRPATHATSAGVSRRTGEPSATDSTTADIPYPCPSHGAPTDLDQGLDCRQRYFWHVICLYFKHNNTGHAQPAITKIQGVKTSFTDFSLRTKDLQQAVEATASMAFFFTGYRRVSAHREMCRKLQTVLAAFTALKRQIEGMQRSGRFVSRKSCWRLRPSPPDGSPCMAGRGIPGIRSRCGDRVEARMPPQGGTLMWAWPQLSPGDKKAAIPAAFSSSKYGGYG